MKTLTELTKLSTRLRVLLELGSNLWETTSPRFPTFETTVVGLDRARSLAAGENCWNVRPQALQSQTVNTWYPGTCKQIKEKIMHMRNEEKNGRHGIPIVV